VHQISALCKKTFRRSDDRPSMTHGKSGKPLYSQNAKHNRVREAGARVWPYWCGLLEAAAGQVFFDRGIIRFSCEIDLKGGIRIGREVELSVVSSSIENDFGNWHAAREGGYGRRLRICMGYVYPHEGNS